MCADMEEANTRVKMHFQRMLKGNLIWSEICTQYRDMQLRIEQLTGKHKTQFTAHVS